MLAAVLAAVMRTVHEQVVCEVISIHWDRLDVKVAVRYPKSYGPRDRKGRNRLGEGNVDQDQVFLCDMIAWLLGRLIHVHDYSCLLSSLGRALVFFS